MKYFHDKKSTEIHFLLRYLMNAVPDMSMYSPNTAGPSPPHMYTLFQNPISISDSTPNNIKK